MLTNKNYIRVISDNSKIEYTFIPNPINLESIDKLNLIHSNDIYEKYNCRVDITGDLIICSNINILDKFNYIVEETYTQYLEIKNLRDPEKDKWIHNIIDGYAEKKI